MVSEVKHRKKEKKQSDGATESEKREDEEQKTKKQSGENDKKLNSHFKTVICLLTLASCGALGWVVQLHQQRFSLLEEKYLSLLGRTSRLLDMEQEFLRVSDKLAASEDDLQAALSSISTATRLQQEVSALQAAVAAAQSDDAHSSRQLQEVNAHFLNVTDTWQQRLAAINAELAELKAQSRDGHASATQRVNEAERRARSLAKQLEELQDATKRNANALQRTEEEDAKRAQEHLHWNTNQIQRLEAELSSLRHGSVQLDDALQELRPQVQECEHKLPQVEEVVRSVIKLGSQLSATDRRLQEVTLQVFTAEDAMLTLLSDVLTLQQEVERQQQEVSAQQQEVSAQQAHGGVRRMKEELKEVKEAVLQLATVLRDSRANGGGRGLQHQDETVPLLPDDVIQ